METLYFEWTVLYNGEEWESGQCKTEEDARECADWSIHLLLIGGLFDESLVELEIVEIVTI